MTPCSLKQLEREYPQLAVVAVFTLQISDFGTNAKTEAGFITLRDEIHTEKSNGEY